MHFLLRGKLRRRRIEISQLMSQILNQSRSRAKTQREMRNLLKFAFRTASQESLDRATCLYPTVALSKASRAKRRD